MWMPRIAPGSRMPFCIPDPCHRPAQAPGFQPAFVKGHLALPGAMVTRRLGIIRCYSRMMKPPSWQAPESLLLVSVVVERSWLDSGRSTMVSTILEGHGTTPAQVFARSTQTGRTSGSGLRNLQIAGPSRFLETSTKLHGAC
jgi:hypothetical protein